MKYQVMPPLSTEEKNALRASIAQEGIRDPIVKDEYGHILDGYHRYQIAPNDPKCDRDAKIIKGLTDAEKEAFAIHSNDVRRNMTPPQRKELQNRKKELARALRKQDPKKYTNAVVGAKLACSEATVSRWLDGDASNLHCKQLTSQNKTVKTGAFIKPDARVKINPNQHEIIYRRIEEDENETYEQVAADYGVSRQAISNIYNKVKRKTEKIEENKLAAQRYQGDSDKYEIHHGDFYEICEGFDPESIDHIITDPPYHKEYLPLWGQLAETAKKILKPGGFLITYTGKLFLPEVIGHLSKHLDYYFAYTLLYSGPSARIYPVKVYVKSKLLLVYYKPPKTKSKEFMSDLIKGTGREKDLHDWAQSLDEIKPMIENFTNPGDLILDPFGGSGTTLAACISLNRKCIGIDIDGAAVETMRGRVAEAVEASKKGLIAS